MPGRHTVALLSMVFATLAVSCTVAAPAPPAQAMNASLQPLVDGAVADLAQRLQVAPTAIAVVDARAVVWPDRSLGCPQPGMMYPQVLTDGVFIRLEARGRRYTYHGGGTRAPFLCTSPDRRDPPASGGGTVTQ